MSLSLSWLRMRMRMMRMSIEHKLSSRKRTKQKTQKIANPRTDGVDAATHLNDEESQSKATPMLTDWIWDQSGDGLHDVCVTLATE